MANKERIRVFEVGPRDGIQNEPGRIAYADKLKLLKGLIAAGVRDIELGAFVRPDKVPQMADSERLLKEVKKLKVPGLRTWSLVPNRKGLERAIQAGAEHIAIFTAATDSFAKANIGMTVAESLVEYREVVREAHAAKIKVRGYVSTAFGCPYEGKVKPAKAFKVIQRLLELGVFQVSIGDTIGVATPSDVTALIDPAIEALGPDCLAAHFHDTRGTALANALTALMTGVRTIDSSIGGLGGCPYAPGASGNLATEDLVYLLNGTGLRSDIDIDKLCKTSLEFSRRIKRPLSSKYLQAYAAAKNSPRKSAYQ